MLGSFQRHTGFAWCSCCSETSPVPGTARLNTLTEVRCRCKPVGLGAPTHPLAAGQGIPASSLCVIPALGSGFLQRPCGTVTTLAKPPL